MKEREREKKTKCNLYSCVQKHTFHFFHGLLANDIYRWLWQLKNRFFVWFDSKIYCMRWDICNSGTKMFWEGKFVLKWSAVTYLVKITMYFGLFTYKYFMSFDFFYALGHCHLIFVLFSMYRILSYQSKKMPMVFILFWMKCLDHKFVSLIHFSLLLNVFFFNHKIEFCHSFV